MEFQFRDHDNKNHEHDQDMWEVDPETRSKVRSLSVICTAYTRRPILPTASTDRENMLTVPLRAAPPHTKREWQ